MRDLRVPQGSLAVACRGGVGGFGEGVTPRLLQRHQERQVRLAAAADRVLGVLGSAHGATHGNTKFEIRISKSETNSNQQ